MNKCKWAYRSPEEERYHDQEWGHPVHDDQKLFEYLVLEVMQAGLSWTTIMKRREAMRLAFEGFSAERLAAYDETDIQALLENSQIIRHRLKLQALVTNGRAFLNIVKTWGSFDAYIWSFTGGKTLVGSWKSMEDIPPITPWAEYISRDMKKKGFTFVGPTIIQAFLQAIGVSNDHLVSCPSYQELVALKTDQISYEAFEQWWVKNHSPETVKRETEE